MQELILTAVGPDRPGLVDELTGRLLEAGANVADSRMVNLRGQFAVILLIEASDAVAALLGRTMTEAGERMGLSVNCSAAGATPGATPTAGEPRGGVPYRLRTYAMDQPGIVHRITHALNAHGVNIEELQTHLESAAHSGTPLFTMDLRMTVPPSVAVKQLRDELEALCAELNCDADLQPG